MVDTWGIERRPRGAARGEALRVREEEVSAMKTKSFCRFHLAGFLCLVMAGSLGLAGQARPSNLFKEVVDRKARIVWRNAPQNAIPADVCMLLQTCAGAPDKLIALPAVTEAGKGVAGGW